MNTIGKKNVAVLVVCLFIGTSIALPYTMSTQTNVVEQSRTIITEPAMQNFQTYTEYTPPYSYYVDWHHSDFIGSAISDSGANGFVSGFADCFIGGGHAYALQGMNFYVGRQKTVTITARFLTTGIAATVGMPFWAMAKTDKFWVKEDITNTNNFYTEELDPAISPISCLIDSFQFILSFVLPFFGPIIDTLKYAKSIAEIFQLISTLIDYSDLISAMNDMINAGKGQIVTFSFTMNVGPGTHKAYVGTHVAAGGIGASGWAVRYGVIEKIRIDGIAPPDRPTVGGPESGMEGEKYEFWAKCDDPNNDNVQYEFEWGDGDVSPWTPFAKSGETVRLSHKYSKPGTYTIKVRARDIDNMVSSNYGVHTIAIREPQPAKLKLTPSSYDFGEVKKLYCSGPKTFTLENVGDQTATGRVVTSPIINFPITDSTGLDGLNFTLEPGEQATVTLKFCPTSVKEYSGKLTAKGTNCDDVSSTLRGAGTNGCCFPAGTRITMADGSYKNIEDIRVGDRVLAYDLEKQQYYSWTVKLLGHPVHQVYDINDGLISLTCSHPMYVKKLDEVTGWGAINPQFAQEVTRVREDMLPVEVGDFLMKIDGNWIEISNITCKPERVQTYNIRSFIGKQTYFANDILVFEENPPISFMIENFPWVVKNNIMWLKNLILQIIENMFISTLAFG